MTEIVIPISGLPSADLPLDGDELVPLVQDGTTKKATAGQISGVEGAVLVVGIAAGHTALLSLGITDVTRLNVTAAGVATVGGLANGTDGKKIIFTNVGADEFTLNTEDATAAAENRFAANGDTLVLPRCSATFVYVEEISRWSRSN